MAALPQPSDKATSPDVVYDTLKTDSGLLVLDVERGIVNVAPVIRRSRDLKHNTSNCAQLRSGLKEAFGGRMEWRDPASLILLDKDTNGDFLGYWLPIDDIAVLFRITGFWCEDISKFLL